MKIYNDSFNYKLIGKIRNEKIYLEISDEEVRWSKIKEINIVRSNIRTYL